MLPSTLTIQKREVKNKTTPFSFKDSPGRPIKLDPIKIEHVNLETREGIKFNGTFGSYLIHFTRLRSVYAKSTKVNIIEMYCVVHIELSAIDKNLEN